MRDDALKDIRKGLTDKNEGVRLAVRVTHAVPLAKVLPGGKGTLLSSGVHEGEPEGMGGE